MSRLREAKGLSRSAARSFASRRRDRSNRMTDQKQAVCEAQDCPAARSFASLRMTGPDLAGGEELPRACEPCLNKIDRRAKSMTGN